MLLNAHRVIVAIRWLISSSNIGLMNVLVSASSTSESRRSFHGWIFYLPLADDPQTLSAPPGYVHLNHTPLATKAPREDYIRMNRKSGRIVAIAARIGMRESRTCSHGWLSATCAGRKSWPLRSEASSSMANCSMSVTHVSEHVLPMCPVYT